MREYKTTSDWEDPCELPHPMRRPLAIKLTHRPGWSPFDHYATLLILTTRQRASLTMTTKEIEAVMHQAWLDLRPHPGIAPRIDIERVDVMGGVIV